MITSRLFSDDIMCGGCAASISKVFAEIDGICEVSVNVETKHVTIAHDASLVTIEHLLARLEHAGFSAILVSP